MLRRVALLLTVAGVMTCIAIWKTSLFPAATPFCPSTEPTALSGVQSTPADKPLYPPIVSGAPASIGIGKLAKGDPILIPDCRLTVIDKQEVPSQRDGVLWFIGTEIEPGQMVPPEQIISIPIGNQEQRFRRLKEGDLVKAGQLLAYLDDQLSRDDWAIKNARIASSRADLEAALKTSEESRNRYETQLRLRQEGRGATSEEDVRAAKLNWDRAAYDAVSKREAVTLAERELSQAETILRMHQIRAATSGVIQTIYKKAGEAVKSYEPVFQIHNLNRLRVEGLVDEQYLPSLQVGMRAIIEPGQPQGPRQTLIGHLQPITAIAVAKDAGNLTIVSASEDGTVRIWDLATRRERRILHHAAAVLAVACTSPSAGTNLCLTGTAEGMAFLWDLDSKTDQARELHGGHTGAITSVAFSPDGRTCVTGGEDRAICLWNTTEGSLRYRFPDGHRGAITSLQFTPRSQLVSAGRDNSLRLWILGEQSARMETTLEQRSGDVTQPGVHPDGHCVLFDQGNVLRLLSLPDGMTEGTVQSAAGGMGFGPFALFSPDARLIMTAGARDGRVQLWRSSAGSTHASLIRQLTAREPLAVTCGTWASDGSFVAAGTRDRQILVWPAPSPAEVERQLTAQITLIEQAVASTSRQVRIWAEVPNPDRRLLPGATVTLAIEAE